MSIDWEAGEITEEQHRLWPEQVSPIVACLEESSVAYIDADALRADVERNLWLDPQTITYTEEKARALNEAVDLCRVVRIKEGFIVDVSASDFELDADSDRAIRADTDYDYDRADWLPVVGLVENTLEREGLGSILFRNYDVVLGPSALDETADPEDETIESDDIAEPGDGEAPA